MYRFPSSSHDRLVAHIRVCRPRPCGERDNRRCYTKLVILSFRWHFRGAFCQSSLSTLSKPTGSDQGICTDMAGLHQRRFARPNLGPLVLMTVPGTATLNFMGTAVAVYTICPGKIMSLPLLRDMPHSFNS